MENIYVSNHKLYITAELWLNNMILAIIFLWSLILYYKLAEAYQIWMQLIGVES